MTEYDEGGRYAPSREVAREMCPKCGRNHLSIYDDGHQHCFTPGCDYHKPPEGEARKTKGKPRVSTPKAGDLLSDDRITPFAAAYRGLKPETLRRYNYGRVLVFGKKQETVDIWPLFNGAGDIAFQKVRHPTDASGNKKFDILHGDDDRLSPNDCQLFGRTVWGDQSDKRVIITEGEIDAMSVAQCTNFKYPVVSVNGGAESIEQAIRSNYRWLDRFSEIILWLDDDKPGKEATAKAVKCFEVGRVKIAKIQGYKDANEALLARKYAEIENAIFAAVTWRPQGVVNAYTQISRIIGRKALPYWEWPFKKLQERTRGAVRGKLYYHVAGTGVGKTTVIIEALNHFTKDTGTEAPAKIGYIGLETDMEELLQDLLTPLAGQRLKLDPVSDTRLQELAEEMFGPPFRWELFDPQEAEWTVDAIYGYIRYMARALGCNIIVLDPLSAIAAMMPSSTDERKALDSIGMTLARLAKELGVNIHVAHHLTRPSGDGPAHEEGAKTSLKQVRGSGGIANHADGVLGYERNQQADTEEAKLITIVRVLKWRLTGYTGIGCYTIYDPITGRTTELSEADALRILGATEGHGSKAPPSSEFHGMEHEDEDAPF